MEKINFEAGKQITPAKINEDGTITPAVWEGKTPLTPYVLNLMQTNIENAITENKVTDSSWKDLILTENFVNYNSSTKNMYRKYGNIVEVIGMVKPKTILAKGASTVCFQLPDGYRPEHQVTVICPGSEKNNWLLTINTNGNAEVARYGTTEYIDISTSTCLAYHVSFFVKAGDVINSNLESYGDRIADLEKENNELAQQMPWNTTSGKSIHITDSAKYSKNKLSISGDMEQEKRSGKNKFKIPESATSNGVTLTKNADGSFTLNGTTTGVAVFNATLNNPLKAGTYTISYKSSIALGDSFFLRVRDKNNILVNSAVPVSQVQGNNSTHNTATYTSNIESAIVAINLTKVGVTYNNVVIYAQLEEGTTATEVEQYGAMPSTEFPSMPVTVTGTQKIVQFGKNWFDETKASKNTYINGYGANTPDTFGKINTSQVTNLSDYIPVLKGENCLLSFDYATLSNTNLRTYVFFDKNKNTINEGKNNTYSPTEKKANLIAPADGYLRFCYPHDAYNVQIEKGVVQNSYELYTEETHSLDLSTTQLCAIKDTNGNVVAQDRHVFRNGKWQWEKKIKKRVLNGTEDWQSNSNWNKEDTEIYHAYINLTDWKIGQKDVALDKFKFYGYTSWGDCKGKECCACNVINRSLYIFISTDKLETKDVAGLKKWLQNNNITMYYILATPEYIDCTAEQSAVLDKLYSNFALQKGTNNIIVESENGVGVNLELDYMQDNILKDKKLEDRVTALENLLSTTQTSALLLDNLQNDLESEVN